MRKRDITYAGTNSLIDIISDKYQNKVDGDIVSRIYVNTYYSSKVLSRVKSLLRKSLTQGVINE